MTSPPSPTPARTARGPPPIDRDARPVEEITADQTLPTRRADDRRLSRVERAKMPRAIDVLTEVATSNGVCINLVPMRRTNLTTGEPTVIGVPCGSTLASKCPACAQSARRLRMQQCREGWHLDTEPDLTPDEATDDQADLVTWRTALEDIHADADEASDLEDRNEIDHAITEVGDQMLTAGIRGSLPHPADPAKSRRTRSTKRRQDAPNLPPISACPSRRCAGGARTASAHRATRPADTFATTR